MSKEKESNKTTIRDYLVCAYPSVAVETFEEERFVGEMVKITKIKGFENFKVLTMSASQNLVNVSASGTTDPAIIKKGCNYKEAFEYAAANPDVILVVFDFQHMINNGAMYRALKDQFVKLKAKGSCIILVAPAWSLPQEMTHEIPVIDMPLPTREQLGQALEVVVESAHLAKLDEETRISCLDAASGLTLQEAEGAYSLSVAKTRSLAHPIVTAEKMKLIKSSGLLELAPPPPVSPGGLGELYAYVDQEVIPVKDDPLLQCRGIMLVGVPGGGKSLSAKAIGHRMQWPVLKLSFGSLKGGIVGQSESQIKAALKLADAVAPCVLWADEVEKGVGGHASSAQSDGGTTLGMLGIWLEWLQEHTTTVFTVATCNDFSKLPSELTRAGRFDERFFVDLPSLSERIEIAEVHLIRYGIQDGLSLSADVAELTESWTGAEIEQLIKSAARRTKRQLTREALAECAKAIRPIAKVKEADIKALRDWAKDALRPANTQESTAGQTARKIRNTR